VEKNRSIIARSLVTQMQELISEPCHSHDHRDPVVILIDGLDECDGHGFKERCCAQSESYPPVTQSSFGSSSLVTVSGQITTQLSFKYHKLCTLILLVCLLARLLAWRFPTKVRKF
ncbi:hypothetical protein B0H14DRAFT_2409925, partial [Mycena olivaceomarginata]